MTPLGLGPKQSYNPTTNTDTQEPLDNLNFTSGAMMTERKPPLALVIVARHRWAKTCPSHRSLVLYRADFDMLVDSNELLPELPVPPGLSSHAEPAILEKREHSDSCPESPTLKPQQKQKPVFVRKYNLRQLPTRNLERLKTLRVPQSKKNRPNMIRRHPWRKPGTDGRDNRKAHISLHRSSSNIPLHALHAPRPTCSWIAQ
ncbi:hypothetical protein EMCG_00575 [[Emmonsia] crescens]|uniref:Uncharacterized protein n=1 Tax=[Emmonsia] crescens TaxID=73230 RepID=A0A0G2HTV9_9EURO|nr:hypothetical protein EMCG_00575 [Emmonsia crescens UAMH 3008]